MKKHFCRECGDTTEEIKFKLEDRLVDSDSNVIITLEELFFCSEDCKNTYVNDAIEECT